MRAIPALFAVLILATVAPTLAPSQPPTPPVPVVAPLAEITPTVESATVALVDGKWIDAEVRRISARICVDGDAKFVQLRVRKLVTVTIGGQTIDVVSAAPVDVIELVARDGRCYGITAGKGRYQVEVIASDPERGISIESTVVAIGEVEPDPDDPDPPPVVDDAPFQSDGFAVLVIKESTAVLPESQRSIFTSAAVHRYCHTKAQRLSDGGPFYRMWDDDYEDAELANAPAELQAAYKAVEPESLPWIAISDGKGGGFSGPLPATVDETLELLKRYGDG